MIKFVVVTATLVGIACPHASHAGWPADGMPAETSAGQQTRPALVQDGEGGIFVLWTEARDPSEPSAIGVRARRFSMFGDPAPGWPDTSLPVSAVQGMPYGPKGVLASSGDLYAAWTTTEGGVFGISLQRLLRGSQIAPGWPDSGIPVCERGDCGFPLLAPDRSGGIYVAWGERLPNEEWELRLLRFGSDGVVANSWPDSGLVVTHSNEEGLSFRLEPDLEGGAYLAWVVHSSGELFCQRVSPSASVHSSWPAPGRSICASPNGRTLGDLEIARDGNVFLLWQDGRDDLGDIYCGCVRPNGEVPAEWPENGLAVGALPGEQGSPDGCASEAGDLLVVWTNHDGDRSVFAQRLTAYGSIAAGWPPAGLIVASRGIPQVSPWTFPDAFGGALLGWTSYEPPTMIAGLWSHHLQSDGTPASGWPDEGKLVRSGELLAEAARPVPDGQGGVYFAWSEAQNVAEPRRVFVQRVSERGQVGPPVPATPLELSAPRPNPAFGSSTITFTLRVPSEVRVEVMDLSGRRVRMLHRANMVPAGEHRVVWRGDDDAGRILPPSMYHVVVSTPTTRRFVRLALLR